MAKGNDGVAHLEFGSVEEMAKRVALRKLELARTMSKKEAEIVEVDRQMWKLNESCKGGSAAVITASIFAKRECQVEFQLTYRMFSLGRTCCYRITKLRCCSR